MITRSFWFLSSWVVFLVVVGLITTKNTLILLAIPLMIYLITAAVVAPDTPQLTARRSLSTDRITEGMLLTVRVLVENQSEQLDEIHLFEAAPPAVKDVAGDHSKVALLKPGNSLEYEYELKGWRGNHQFKGLLARINEPFGLFEIQKDLAADGKVLVYPQITKLKAIPIRPPQTKGFSGPIASRKSGTGMNFFGVRQYQLGDSLRRINWKTSARHTTDLFTNEYEQEQIADVCLILDGRPHSEIARRGRSLFEFSVHAAASLAEMFLGEGHSLSLLVYAAGITQVFPGYGKVHYERVLKTLAQASTGVNFALENLSSFPTRMLPPRGQLIFISPLTATDLAPLIHFRARGYAVLVISPDPLDFENRNETRPGQPDFQLARRLAQIERDLLISTLRKAEIQVVNWPVQQSLSEVIETVRMPTTLRQRTTPVLQ